MRSGGGRAYLWVCWMTSSYCFRGNFPPKVGSQAVKAECCRSPASNVISLTKTARRAFSSLWPGLSLEERSPSQPLIRVPTVVWTME